MSNDLPIELKPRTPESVPPPAGPNPEDSSSRAMSEALQSSFILVKIMMGILVIVFMGSGLFIVKSGEQAIKLRFGKPVGGLLGPGMHWAFPAPIDEVKKVSLGMRQEAASTIGMPVDPSSQRVEETPTTPRNELNPAVDGYTLTADTNIIHARASVTYKISDPVRFIFGLTNAPGFVTNALNNALIYASSRFTVDEMLTTKPAAFTESVEARLRQLADQQDLGISVEKVFTFPYAPAKLKGVFEAVTTTDTEADQTNKAALTYATTVIADAQAKAYAITNSARVTAESYVNTVKIEATNFLALLEQFNRNPSYYTEARRTEAISQALANAKVWNINQRNSKGTREIWLQLNPKPERRTVAPSE